MNRILDFSALTPLEPASDLVLVLVRVIFGFTFLYYGWPKLRDLRANAGDFDSMGFKPGWLFGTPVAFLETFGAAGIILGVFTWLAAAGFVLHMAIGTIWKITATDKTFTDWSYDLLLLSIALVLLVAGPGNINLLSIF